jgi:hypothetical protein
MIAFAKTIFLLPQPVCDPLLNVIRLSETSGSQPPDE